MSVTYGTIDHDRGHWLVTCPPHVRARLKRVFPRAPQHASSVVTISDSPENTRDLEWFIQRYPMTVTDAALMRSRAAAHEDMEAAVAAMMARELPLEAYDLALPPREYQRIGAQASTIRGGLLLADDLGLGKTVTAICNLTRPDYLPAVVVCDTHLPTQWAAEIAKFAPHLRVHIARSGQPYPLIRSPRSRQADLWEQPPHVLILNYHKLRGWAETLAGQVRYVVYDEVQKLRNADSLIYKAAGHLSRSADLNLGLSATPIYGYGAEFFHVIDVLLPGALGTREEFLREWCTAERDGKASIQDPERFGSYLRSEGIMLRRTRAEVGRELPPMSKIVHTIDANLDVLDKVAGDAVALARTIVAHNEQFRGQKMQAAGEFDVLVRQATGIAKAPYVADFVRFLVESGERVVLFGWHREVYNIWMERLSDLSPVLYTGTEDLKEKDDSKQRFISGESRLLIMSLRSGAGVDKLQDVCSTCVFGELDWAPGVHEQCIGRLHRDGQNMPVMAYYLVTDHGSDPIVAEVLGVKREQIEGVRNPRMGMAERIDTGESQIRRLAQAFLRSRNHADAPEVQAA